LYEWVAALGHQVGLKASRAADETDGGARREAHESIGGIQCRLKMTRRSAGREDYVHQGLD
jgi:hypothetical protein